MMNNESGIQHIEFFSDSIYCYCGRVYNHYHYYHNPLGG